MRALRRGPDEAQGNALGWVQIQTSWGDAGGRAVASGDGAGGDPLPSASTRARNATMCVSSPARGGCPGIAAR